MAIYNIEISDDTVDILTKWLDAVDTVPISMGTKPKNVEELVNFIINQNLSCYVNLANNFSDNQLLSELKANPESLADIKAKVELKLSSGLVEEIN